MNPKFKVEGREQIRGCSSTRCWRQHSN